MRVIGLTGGMAMGKSTATTMLRHMGAAVHDSDATVHQLYARRGAAVAPVSDRFPRALKDGAIDRQVLSRAVIGDAVALKDLEAIMHPLVRAASHKWMQTQRARRTNLVILDIPLLFETGRDAEMDAIWVVHCAPFLQAQRVLRRPGMTQAKMRALLSRQFDQNLRLKQADSVFPTGRGKATLYRTLAGALKAQP